MITPAVYPSGVVDDAADAHLARSDAVMADLVARLGPIIPPEVTVPPDMFGSLIMAIVRQQLAAGAATAIYDRLLHYFGDRVPAPEALLSAGPQLRTTVGLSHAKDRTMRALAQRISSGELDLDRLPSLSDEEVARALTSVTGIGAWTAGVFLMFRLKRPDILLAGDLGIRRAAQLAYRLDELPRPKALEAIAAPWRPYRTRGCHYLWAFLASG